MKVGFIGAGRMRRPMVARLVEAGHDVRALGRTDDKRRDFEQLGATAVNQVTEAVARADGVLLCLFTDEQVRQVCLDSALLPAMGPARPWSCTPPPARRRSKPSRRAPATSTSSMHRSAGARTT